ncbi:T9SS type B sorting domain-containing protein [Flavobacterium pedocola]
MWSFRSKGLFLFFFICFQLSFSQNDCTDAIVACGNSNFSGLSATNAGIQELSGSNSCSSEENNSIWLKVVIENSGTLAFTLTPENPDIDVDFDFFVFGPNATCGNIGMAIRCSTTNPAASNQTNNLTGLSDTETDVSEGPGPAGNSFVSSINATAGDVYFIVIDRPVGTSNFSLDWTGTATFSTPPTVNNTTSGNTLDISKCDTDGTDDDVTNFDLTPSSALAIGAQSNVVATFHLNLNDALTNTNGVSNLTNFRNTSNPQQLILRLTNSITGCFSTKEINLNVTPFTTNDPANLHECDLDNNGFTAFNLNDNNAVLTNNDPSLTITYHPSNGSPTVLPNPYTNQAAFTNETVWAKITSANGCFVYKPFDLIIERIPNAVASQLTQCDFQLSPDGFTTFELTQANSALTGGNSNYTTSFFLTATDAQANTGALNSTFINTQNPQNIAVKVTDTTTGCYSITTLTLNVNVNPTVTATLHHCDDDGAEDGFTEFDLADAGFETGGNTVTYFATSNDALLETNALPVNYTNTQGNTPITPQVVYARIENGNDCIGINIIRLIVDKLPSITINDNDVYCLNKPTVPVTLNAGIGTQNPNSFTYSWTPNGETTQTINVLAAGTYTVKVTNSLGCFKVRTVIVKESDLAVVENVEIVDLSDNNTVTVFVQGDENDYTYSLDLPNGPFQDSNYFDNVTPGIHNIYISDKDGCGIQKHEISLLSIPNFFTPNGDGFNDTWKIKGMERGHFSNSIIYIFDRFGKLLKQMSPSGEGWNGTFNGQPVPSSDYWYVMHLEDGRTVKGHVSIKR